MAQAGASVVTLIEDPCSKLHRVSILKART